MKKPNILFIMTDQQRADTLECCARGTYQIDAPNLNRLAGESVVFRNAYCTQPVCTPSRSSMISGQWPHTNGCIGNNIALPADAPSVAQGLGGDYHCAYYGKWHLGDELDAQRGFSEWLSIEDGKYRSHYTNPESLNRRSDYHNYLVSHGYPPDKKAADGAMVFSRNFAAGLPERHTKSAFLSREAARFIREYDKEKPFFLTVGFLEPHPPNFSELNELYDPAALEVGPAFFKKPGPEAPNRMRMLAERFAAEGCRDHPSATEADWRRIRANYYGLVTLIDRAVGRILKALDDAGRAEDTLVVFTSDHGDMTGDHALGKKDVLYEQSSHIPLLVRAPWLGREQRLVDGRVSLIDLAPTIIDVGGGEVPAAMQGVTRKDVLEGKATLDDNDVIVEVDTEEEYVFIPWRSIVSKEGWKMNLCADDRCELYDLNTDPDELHNLYDDPAQRERVRDLHARLRRWQEATNDPAPLPAVPA